MIEVLEKTLRLMKEATNCPNTLEKYKKKAARNYLRLSKDLDTIYAKYSKLRQFETKIAEKYDIEIEK